MSEEVDKLKKKLVALGRYSEAPTGSEFGEQLRSRLSDTGDIQNVIKRIAEQRSRLRTIPSEVRASQQPGFVSPIQTASLIAQREEPVRTSLETLRGVKSFREGRLEDIVGRATKGYEAQIDKAQTKYQQAYQQLQDLVEEKRWVAGQTAEKEQMTESTRRREGESARETEDEEGQERESMKDNIASAIISGDYGEGERYPTREKLIDDLALIYRNIPKDTIASEVYGMIPDEPIQDTEQTFFEGIFGVNSDTSTPIGINPYTGTPLSPQAGIGKPSKSVGITPSYLPARQYFKK